MAVSQTILERIFTATESAWGTAATLAGGDYMRHTKCSLIAEQALIPSSDKTGSISATKGASGARSGRWSLEWEGRPNGVAATVPDCDPVLVAAFGKAATAGVYSFDSAIKSFTLGRYRQPSGVMQQIGIGCVVQELGFNFEQNANCMFTASGSCLWVPDSVTFATLDSGGKGGLASVAAEPGSPVSNGSPVNGLAGSASLDGSAVVQIKSASVRLATAVDIPRDRLFAGAYGSAPERDILGVTLDLSIIDEDIAGVTGLYVKALAGTTVNITLTAGTTSGARIVFTFANCLLPMPALDDSARKWAANLSGIQAYATTASSLDEMTLSFT
jgi:hypothetical protein